MRVKDKKVGEFVNVADKRCLGVSCYWPRPDPGSFTQGQGYTTRPGKREWLCGTREAHGCPYRLECPSCGTMHPEYETKCRKCGGGLTVQSSRS